MSGGKFPGLPSTGGGFGATAATITSVGTGASVYTGIWYLLLVALVLSVLISGLGLYKLKRNERRRKLVQSKNNN